MKMRFLLALRRSLLCGVLVLGTAALSLAQKEDEVRGALAEPDDAAETRAQMATVEKLLPTYADRGAALYFLAIAHQHLGETREAMELLKECMALEEGFDPSESPEFAGLRKEKAFQEMVDRAAKRFPGVGNARIAMVTEARDLIPEGLAWDAKREVFYLSSLHRRKIVELTPDGHATDFVGAAYAAGDSDALLPVLGIRLDPRDGSVWANTWEEKAGGGRSQLLHVVPGQNARTVARFSAAGPVHGFNDLVVRRTGEVLVTDSANNQVLRFDAASKSFTPLVLHRPILYPNGIALAEDEQTVFIADALGVIHYDLATASSADVVPGPHATLAGVDGLYWHRGGLVAIQNGIGVSRVAYFRLAADGLHVSKVNVLEYRTALSVLPTTGAIRGNDFYFIANSQIDNLNGDKLLDPTRLEPVRIAVVRLP